MGYIFLSIIYILENLNYKQQLSNMMKSPTLDMILGKSHIN